MFKKLATLVCAAAMAASAFTGVVANAAVERDEGVNLTAEKTADNQITVKAYAVGYDSIMGFNLNFGVTGASVESVNADYAAISGGQYNVVDESFVATLASTTDAVSLTDNLMLTITFTFSEDISNDVTITIEDESSVMKGNNEALEYYAEDLADNPEWVTLGFNDAVVKASEPEEPGTEVTITPSVEAAQAYVNMNDAEDKAVVGKINVSIEGGSYVFNRNNISYEGRHPAVTDLAGNELSDADINATLVSANDIIVYVVINGTDDVNALKQIVFE